MISESELKKEYTQQMCAKIQYLIALRRSKMSQEEMSKTTGISLKTIQRFENYKSDNCYLLFCYKKLLQ